MGGRGASYATVGNSETIKKIPRVSNFKKGRYLLAGSNFEGQTKNYMNGYTFDYNGHKFGIAKFMGKFSITDIKSGNLIGTGSTQKEAMKHLVNGDYEKIIKTEKYKAAVRNFRKKRK